MLPPGHIAAGYLTAEALLKFSHQTFTVTQVNQLLFWGMFFGFAPDLDTFYLFAKQHSFKIDPRKSGSDHRKYISHAPILWLIAGLLVCWLAPNGYWKTFGLLVWLGSWSHFILDSIQHGIAWFWPVNKKLYALFPIYHQSEIQEAMGQATSKNFFTYWIIWLGEYAKGVKITLICECILLLGTILLIYFK